LDDVLVVCGGSAVVSGGLLTVDGQRARYETWFSPGQSLQFVATFSNTGYQHVGFGGGVETYNTFPWAMFSTGSDGSQLYARTYTGGPLNDIALGNSYLNAPHLYRIDWNLDGSVIFYIDDVPVANGVDTITDQMRVAGSDLFAGGGTLSMDWFTIPPYSSACTFDSRVLGSGIPNIWNTANWDASIPANTTLELSIRYGDTSSPDASWSAYQPLVSSPANLGFTARYVQYQAVLSTADLALSPTLNSVSVSMSQHRYHTSGDNKSQPRTKCRHVNSMQMWW
jgi:hypothetical protein